MSGRRYRVVKRLPWIEGGNPTPEAVWEGGEFVIYEPGDTVYMEDQDLENRYLSLEAIDDAGRVALEEARAKAEVQIIAVADLSSSNVEFLTHALDEKRRLYDCELVRDIAVLRDGSEVVLSTRYIARNPLPGVVHGDDGLPDPWATALQRERWEKERERREMESTLNRIRKGASRGGRRGRETKQDKAARRNKALLADVRAYRAKHPSHGRPAIAAALVDEHGTIRDHTDSRGREKAIEALRKKIDRLEKSPET